MTVILDRVTKTYAGRDVVADLSYALAPGQVVALVGHNGAGKTTQIKMMLGLTRPTSGHVEVLDADPGSRAARLFRARDLGFLCKAEGPARAGP